MCVVLGAIACKRRCFALVTLSLTLTVLWVFATPHIAHWLETSAQTDSAARPIEGLPNAAAIVVFGGMLAATGPKLEHADFGGAVDRLFHAERLYAAAKAPRILLSGGNRGSSPLPGEADFLKRMLEKLGVPAADIIIETNSTNTRENALESARILTKLGIEHVLLVTSALHMERAAGALRSAGISVTAAATDHQLSKIPEDFPGFMPNAGALSQSSRVLRELLARRVYAWLGWLDAANTQ